MSSSKLTALKKLGIGDDFGRPARKRKQRPNRRELPKIVVCAFCGQSVPGKDTRMTAIGRGCKKHRGV